jgi:hypothetical protein
MRTAPRWTIAARPHDLVIVLHLRDVGSRVAWVYRSDSNGRHAVRSIRVGVAVAPARSAPDGGTTPRMPSTPQARSSMTRPSRACPIGTWPWDWSA